MYFIGGGRFRYTHALNCNVYAVVGKDGVALIDAGAGFDVADLLKSLRAHGVAPDAVRYLLLTHSHWDHARGAREVKSATGCEVAVHTDGRAIVEQGPWVALGTPAPPAVTFEPTSIDIELSDGFEIDLGDRVLRTVTTPGHSNDSVCFELIDDGTCVLFSGDTVLAGGRPGITTADTVFSDYKRSLERLEARGVDMLLPGHGHFVLEGGHEQVAYLSERLSSKWVDIGSTPYPPPFESGAWFLRENPELIPTPE